MSQEKLESDAKNLLLEIDQEYEFNELLSNNQRMNKEKQLINQVNINDPTYINNLGRWNEENELKQINIQYCQNTPQQKEQKYNNYKKKLTTDLYNNDFMTENIRNAFLLKKINKLKIRNKIGTKSRQNSLKYDDSLSPQNNRSFRSLEVDKFPNQEKSNFKLNEYPILQNIKKISIRETSETKKNEKQQYNIIDELLDLNSYNKKSHQTYNFVKSQINDFPSIKKLKQPNLNFMEQEITVMNSELDHQNNEQQQQSLNNLKEQKLPKIVQHIQTPYHSDSTKQLKPRQYLIQENIHQNIDIAYQTNEIFKKINLERKKSILQNEINKQKEIIKQDLDSIYVKQNKKKQIDQQKELVMKYLEQPITLPQILNKNNTKLIITAQNSSEKIKNQIQQQGNQQIEQPPKQSSQNTPTKQKYKGNTSRQTRMIDQVEKQGRKYLSFSPPKTRNNEIKFYILNNQNINCSPQFKNSSIPTVQDSPIRNEDKLIIIDQKNIDEGNKFSQRNIKQIILSKISQHNSPIKYTDSFLKSVNAYESIKRQRADNIHNFDYRGLISNRSVNKNNKGNQNILQIFDDRSLSKYTNSLSTIENSILQSQVSTIDSNFKVRSQNNYKQENFLIKKSQIDSALLKIRPRMNLQKINKIKKINYDLESTLFEQKSTISSHNLHDNENKDLVSLSPLLKI